MHDDLSSGTPDEHSQTVVLANGRSLSRRELLGAVGTGLAAAAVPSIFGTATASAAQTVGVPRAAGLASAVPAQASPSASAPKILVLLTLYGGNDGLNTIVPYTNSSYYQARGATAHQPDKVLRLDNSFGLNPAMTGLKALWDAKRLAVVHGVGYPNPNRSHFRSMDIWQTGVPDRLEVSGWLGRWFDATGPDPLRMINIGPSLPRAMVSIKNGGGAALPSGQLKLPGSAGTAKAFDALSRGSSGRGVWADRVTQNAADMQRVINSLGPILQTGSAASGSNLEGGAVATGDAPSVLDQQFDEIATLIRGGAPTRVYSAALGGFDTHASEKEQHVRLVGAVDRAVSRFVNAMRTDPRGAGVVVMMYSEFGRRVAVNLSEGTDHGTAGPVLVCGPGVKGGFYGEPPSLTDLDQGDLRFTTDFRSVYATLAGSVLGVDPALVLGKAFSPIPFL